MSHCSIQSATGEDGEVKLATVLKLQPQLVFSKQNDAEAPGNVLFIIIPNDSFHKENTSAVEKKEAQQELCYDPTQMCCCYPSRR